MTAVERAWKRKVVGLPYLLHFFFSIVGSSTLPYAVAQPQSDAVSPQLGERIEIHRFLSPSLDGEAEYSVLIPPSYKEQNSRDYPVVYFLHGMNNDHTSWTQSRYGDIPARLQVLWETGALPEFLFVHPRGDNSFYSNSHDRASRYEDYICEDLIAEIETHFRVHPERQGRALGGTSMGGYGALKIAMKHPQLFASVASGSPIVFLGDDPLASIPAGSGRGSRFRERFAKVFGDPVQREHWRRNSLEELSRTADLTGLRIYFAYGTADRYNRLFPMQQGIEALSRILSERKVSHLFRTFPGEPHGWKLIADHLQEIFAFLTATF